MIIYVLGSSGTCADLERFSFSVGRGVGWGRVIIVFAEVRIRGLCLVILLYKKTFQGGDDEMLKIIDKQKFQPQMLRI